MTRENHVEQELIDYINEAWDVCSSRAQFVIQTILDNGQIDSEEIANAGYVHGARAIGDVRDQGIPLITNNTMSSTGRRIASYTFGPSSEIRRHKYGGRINFPLSLKRDLLERDGLVCKISGDELPAQELTIDHRVPYYISGDINGVRNPDDFMLLSKSMQRSKSWACEHCENISCLFNVETCSSCYWASPEDYTHVAMRPTRQINIIWTDSEVNAYDELDSFCKRSGISVQDYFKEVVLRNFG